MATLARKQFTITDAQGNAVPNASVEVRSEDTGNLVQLYSDRAGASPIGNPFNADSNGFARFYVVGGAYKITASAGSSSLDPWRHVPVGLFQERDTITAVDVAFDPTATGIPVDAVTMQLAIEDLDRRLREGAAAHIFDYIPASMHADIQARISSDDISSYVQDAIDEVGLDRRIYMPFGTYVWEAGASQIPGGSDVFKPGLYLFGDGPGKTIFDNRAGGTNHTDTFATSNGSRIVTVARTAHGVSAESQITIHGASAPVGGLSFDGTWMIESVPDADHFTFNHTDPAGSTTSGSVTYAVTNPLLDIDTTAINKFQQFVHLSDFSILNVTSPTASVGIRVRRAYQVMMERIWINGMTKNGLHFTVPNSTAGDRDGANMVSLRHMRVENCPGWNIDCELRRANAGANELSFLETDQLFVQGGGTSSVASPPPSGGMRWKGQVWNGKNTAFTINENCALYIEGAAGLANTVTLDGLVIENNKKKGVYISGLSRGSFRDIQLYNNDSYVATSQFELDGASYVVRNIEINGAVVRATSGNNPIVAFKGSGANLDKNTCFVRRKSVVWDNFDHTGQTRYSGIGAEGAAFVANKNGTNQTSITSASWVKVTFTTEVFDDDGFYDATNSKWTPAPGRVELAAHVYLQTNLVDQAQSTLALYKNGAAYLVLDTRNSSGTNAFQLAGSAIDVANGTDYYEIYVNAGGAGDKTVNGTTSLTYFTGKCQ
jgi:hypothetical protein